jgi:hypothetical protein
MKRAIVGACVALALTVAVGAQDKKTAMETMDHMAMEKAYSGCVERSQTGSYTLTHSAIAKAKTSTEKADAMKKSGQMMKSDSMMKSDAMAQHGMASVSLALSAAGQGIDLSKHVGHKVTVTGTEGDSMNGMAAFKVKSLKMIGTSCP